jgi:hypothetical protein
MKPRSPDYLPRFGGAFLLDQMANHTTPRGRPAQCAYPGCPAKTDNRLLWGYLASWRGLPDGYYCPAHRDAIEKIELEGGFDDPENDL